MNRYSFGILEFDTLRALVRRRAQTSMARGKIDQLTPFKRIEDLHSSLSLLGEMIALRQRGLRLAFDAVAAPEETLARLKIEGTALEPLSILDLAHLCERALDARAAIYSERETAPGLFQIVATLAPDLAKLTATVRRKILPSGELDDRASAELAGIRRELATARSRITRSLENLMRRSSEAIQEELVTVRNDRFVIPVRSDHQGRIKGVAHGSSSSGATVFVEPLETIEANNELQNLREAEQREIAEILFQLSEDLRRQLPAIEFAATVVSELDFINAKAVFAETFDCVVPKVSDAAGTLEFINARHPLLEDNLRTTGGAVVPVSFKLDEGHPVMVISGANAGGKTVVLKTAGLLSLMALSGLPVPAASAQVPFYRSILADIGDHQSLAANLSTFTSHVGTIAAMIASCETPALVLLDEVGTGTDPEEGSALGVAVVDNFKQRGAQVLATTHYSGLKMYAANEAGVLNASVEFDEKTLQPTYRLLVGLAGSSSGLEIARRFGIPDELIKQAAWYVKQSSLDAIEYLRRIKVEAEEAEHLRVALEEERAATAQKFASLESQFQQRESGRQAEFENSLRRTVAEFEKLSRELLAKIDDRAARVKVEREAEKRAAELKREAQRAAQAVSQRAKTTKPAATVSLPSQLRGVRVVRDGQVVSDAQASSKPSSESEARPDRQEVLTLTRPPRPGDTVRLRTFGTIGTIDRIKDDEAEVRVGSLHMREKLDNLEVVTGSGVSPVSHAPQARAAATGALEEMRRRAATTELHLHSRESNSKFQSWTELNLIGKKTDEAVDLVDKFLDEAFLNGINEVRIIHGHGTGALRRAVAESLADHPHVERFAQAAQDQGGAGATIVALKQ